MLNYETLLSSYDDKLTLMQWLKKVEAALKDASAVSFDVNKTGDATLTFSITFEDGSKLESGEIVLQQGESVASAAIVNGHLILTLTNGDELDAGQLLNGDLNVNGNLTATGKITGAEIVEDMQGYGFSINSAAVANYGLHFDYAGVCKNGNKITFSGAGYIEPAEQVAANTAIYVCQFTGIPTSITDKLVPIIGTQLAYSPILLVQGRTDVRTDTSIFLKTSNSVLEVIINLRTLYNAAEKRFFRFEYTFLLSDNLAA